MKQKKVRLLGLLLAAVMLFSCLPVQALAAEGGWFYLAADWNGTLLIAPERVAYTADQTLFEAARQYGASDFISYKDGPIDEQVLELTGGKGVDCAIIAGGDADTFIPVIKALKPGGNIGNVNYLGSGEYVRLPRAEWGVGMGHKQINGGLMPGGRLRMEKLAALMTNGRLDVKPLITHVYDGWDALPQALRLMKDKPRDLIKPVVRL